MTADELRAEARRLKDVAQARRCLALAAVLDGQPRSAAATLAGMDRQTLRDWVHRYNAEGIAGLCDRPRPGRLARMGAEQRADLDTLVEDGADVARDGVVRWRWADLKKVLSARFGGACRNARSAACRARAVAAGLVMPRADTQAMSLHVAEIARTVAPGAHAVMVMDGAGWHTTSALQVPEAMAVGTAYALLLVQSDR
ncbi:helix-turn-helix domain-containing protein [Methylobacterium sp. JK268]